MYKKILVPLDGSRLAERVLPHAAILAKATGSEVTFAMVLTSDVYLGAGSDKLEGIPEAVTERKDALKGEAWLYLEKVAHEFEGRGVVAHCAVREGDVASEIIAVCRGRRVRPGRHGNTQPERDRPPHHGERCREGSARDAEAGPSDPRPGGGPPTGGLGAGRPATLSHRRVVVPAVGPPCARRRRASAALRSKANLVDKLPTKM